MSNISKRKVVEPDRLKIWKDGDRHEPFSVRNQKKKLKKDVSKKKEYQANYREKLKTDKENNPLPPKETKAAGIKKKMKTKQERDKAKEKKVKQEKKVKEEKDKAKEKKANERKEKTKEYQEQYRKEKKAKQEEDKAKEKKYQLNYKKMKKIGTDFLF